MELATLRGSDKQITWATDLRSKMLPEMDDLIEQFEAAVKVAIADGKAQADDPQIAANRNALLGARVAMIAETSASWWIDHRFHGARSMAKEFAAKGA